MVEQKDDALLLRALPFSDSSLILHVLTKNHGRISLMARGARRAKSPFRASLMPLYHLNVRWREPRTGSMGTLIEVHRLSSLLDEQKILAGQLLLAKANVLFPDGVEHGYEELHKALNLLSKQNENLGLPTAIWSMLSDAGLVGDFTHCWHCASEINLDDKMYWFKAHSLCSKCANARGLELSSGYRKSVLNLLKGEHIKFSTNYLNTWQQITDEVVKSHR